MNNKTLIARTTAVKGPEEISIEILTTKSIESASKAILGLPECIKVINNGPYCIVSTPNDPALVYQVVERLGLEWIINLTFKESALDFLVESKFFDFPKPHKPNQDKIHYKIFLDTLFPDVSNLSGIDGLTMYDNRTFIVEDESNIDEITMMLVLSLPPDSEIYKIDTRKLFSAMSSLEREFANHGISLYLASSTVTSRMIHT